MKAAALLSLLSALATAALFCSSANGNLAPSPIEMHTHLAHEEVICDIKGVEAVVTGTFSFERLREFYTAPVLYLPVYAAEGTPAQEMMPEIMVDEVKMDVHLVEKRWEDAREIKNFGKLPQIDGQRVYWFYVDGLQEQPLTSAEERAKQLTVKIRYTQKLSNDKFIYTPLIPNQKKGKDYGSITLLADRKLTLLDSDKHSFVKDGDKLVVDPSDKRAIVVEAAKPELP